MSKKIDTAVRERDILRAKVEPLGWTLRGWNSLCDYSAWGKHGELVAIGPAVDGLICDNAALRARLAEVERSEARFRQEAASLESLRIQANDRATRAEARVEKLERVREAAKRLRYDFPDPVPSLLDDLDAALAECEEGK